MPLHVPLVGPLRLYNSLPGLLAESLSGSQVRMTSGRDVLFGRLRNRQAGGQK